MDRRDWHAHQLPKQEHEVALMAFLIILTLALVVTWIPDFLRG